VWSTCVQPVAGSAGHDETVFGEDRAEFQHRDGTLTTSMEVLVSGEDDGEVRRLSVANTGRDPREVELTSYAELVLTTAAADNAHPAFAKMFVQTEHLAEYGALVATRRPRSHEEPRVWAAHFAVVEGDIVAEPQFESDRARFLGRGRTVGTAVAMADGRALSNTVGTVLDPIFSLRYRLAIAPGEVVRVAFWTVVAPSRAELLDLVDKHHDRNAFDRGENPGVDPGTGPASAPRHRCRGGDGFSAPGGADLIRRPAFQGPIRNDHARGGTPNRACGRTPFPATCRSSCYVSTTSRTSPRSASCCALTSTGT
jgi:cyclic beta-1,2-glucan synthetase